MGIVNVTPDSFSDGGRFFNAAQAIQHGLRLAADGADVLDIGGESSRPGAAPVSEAEELDRVLPVIEGLIARTDRRLSIDTMKPAVARAAVKAGASFWNDVNGLRTPGALETAAALNADIVVMHMQGEPRTMQAAPSYDDVVAEVGAFLERQCQALAQLGQRRVWIDPGIGFGKTLDHNIALMRALADLKARCARPLLFGASRKSFIGKIEETNGTAPSPAHARLGGSLAAALHAACAGADMLRVHDVAETVQALAVARALQGDAAGSKGHQGGDQPNS
jgi:dihydropteroate synthase